LEFFGILAVFLLLALVIRLAAGSMDRLREELDRLRRER
jgi:hypothetical protein